MNEEEESTPAVRARTVQDALRLLSELEPQAYAEARAQIPPDSLAYIDRARWLGWIPIEHDRHVPTSIFSVLGPEAGTVFFRRLVAEQLSRPLLSTVWNATVRTLGLSPASLLRAAPIGWPAIYRGFGTMRHVVGATGNSGVVRLEGVPNEVLAVDAYPQSFGAFFAGFIDVCDARGFSTVVVDRDRATITISLEWSIAALA